MQTIREVRAAGLACFTCNSDKSPSTNQSWRIAATTVQSVRDESGLGGLPIPVGVLIVDLDLYKGVTRDQASKALGCTIPWEQSLIQTTRSGGEHHAFRVNFDFPQRGNHPIAGLDLRVGGKGYICFGEGYTAENASGVLRLLNILSLPELPIEAYEILKSDKNVKISTIDNNNIDINYPNLLTALAAISPWCDREEWRTVGMALKSGLGATQACCDLFNDWSRGDYDKRSGVPENYDAKSQIQQWNSFSNDGKIKLKTIFYKARMNGWTSMHNYEELIGKLTPVTGTPPAPVMKNLPPPSPAAAPMMKILDVKDIPYEVLDYLKNNHSRNIEFFIENVLHNRVLEINGVLRWWNGREWQFFPEHILDYLLLKSFPDEISKIHLYNSFRKAFFILVPKRESPPLSKKVFFRNIVFDIETETTTPHVKENYNIGTLSVDYNPDAKAPEFTKFIFSIFGNDTKRIKLLQEAMGWPLFTHHLRIEKYIAFTGVPRAGKGVVLKSIQSILGDGFYGSVDFSSLGSPHSHHNLRKYNVCIDSDAKVPKRDDRSGAASTLLKLTTNESQSSRVLYKNETVDGPMNVKLLLASNKIPVLFDDSAASAIRTQILHFDKSFTDKEDTGLFNRLKQELEGIAVWSLEGSMRLDKNGGRFTQPESSIEMQKDLIDDTQPLSDYIEAHIDAVDGAKCHNYKLFDIFKIWRKTSYSNMTSRGFIRALKDTLSARGVTNLEWSTIRIGDINQRGVIGLKIKNSAGIQFSVSPVQGVPPAPTAMTVPPTTVQQPSATMQQPPPPIIKKV